MAGFKLLKRKVGVDEISDDLSDFSLSSPATKIRRLDAELPPIVEEEEPLTLSTPTPNEERALVLFKPLLDAPSSSFSLSLLNSDLLSQIKKNQQPWSKQSEYDPVCDDEQRLAIVPWVPQPSHSSHFNDSSSGNNTTTELMEADEIGGEGEGMMMDVEQDTDTDTYTASNSSSTQNRHHQGAFEGFHHQHCLLPHFPQNTSTPVTLTR